MKLDSQCTSRPSLSYKFRIARDDDGSDDREDIFDHEARQKERLRQVFIDSGKFKSVVEGLQTGDIHIQVRQEEVIHDPYFYTTYATFGLIPSGAQFSLKTEANIYKDRALVDSLQYSQEGYTSSWLLLIFLSPFLTFDRAIIDMSHPGYVLLANRLANEEEYRCM